jgi:tyrosyl-tRNA synthetase
MTARVHGEDDARRAETAASVLFTEGIAGLDPGTLEGALADAPSTAVSRAELEDGLGIVAGLVMTGLAKSNSEARRLLGGRSVYVNGQRLAEERPLGVGDLLHGRWIVLRRGQATQHVLVVTGSA